MSEEKSKKINFRLQGTDGIRGKFIPSKDIRSRNLTPQSLYVDERIITDEFIELYIYGHLQYLKERGLFKEGDGVVLGWDPRDKEGFAIRGAIKGILKSGGVPHCIGLLEDGKPVPDKMLPTPVVPILQSYMNFNVGFMITASHNPASQNGIKAFIGPSGLKTFPSDETRITEYIMNIEYDKLSKIDIEFEYKDCYEEAKEIFITSLLEYNPVITKKPPDTITLVVDHSKGTLMGVALEILQKAGFKEVIEISKKGEINKNCGVVDLEGVDFISSDDIRNGVFSKFNALKMGLDIGLNRKEALKGESLFMIVSFDGDGDRFYLLIYNPFRDGFVVLSGDKLAVIIARFLYKQSPDEVSGFDFVNTIESEISTSNIAEKMGFETDVVSVGDKWLQWKGTLKALKRIENNLPEISPPSAIKISEYIKNINLELLWKNPHTISGIYYENSGHFIMDTYIKINGGYKNVFAGDGMKGCLNSITAVIGVFGNLNSQNSYEMLENLLPNLYKETDHIYYTTQENFRRGTPVFEGLKEIVSTFARDTGLGIKEVKFTSEPDILYYRLFYKKNNIGIIFVRNSGTEIKTGVYFQGVIESSKLLEDLKSRVLEYLYKKLKSRTLTETKIQHTILAKVKKEGGLKLDNLVNIFKGLETSGIKRSEFFDALIKKEGLLKDESGVFELTPQGEIFLNSFKDKE